MEFQVNANITQGDDVLKLLSAFINEEIESYENYEKVKLAAAGEKTITFNSLPYLKGILITSPNRIKVESTIGGEMTEIGRGTRIILYGANLIDLKITNLDKELDIGVVKSYTSDTNDSIECESPDEIIKNYTFSQLIGTVVKGPFILSKKKFHFLSYGHSGVYFALGTITEGANNDETAANVAAALQTAINDNAGFESVTVTYDAAEKIFIVKATQAGAHNLEFQSYEYQTSELYIGMYDGTLKLGGDDHTGKKVEILTGNDKGDILTIGTIEFEDIEFVGNAAAAIAAGDRYRIYDPTLACEVNITVLL